MLASKTSFDTIKKKNVWTKISQPVLVFAFILEEWGGCDDRITNQGIFKQLTNGFHDSLDPQLRKWIVIQILWEWRGALGEEEVGHTQGCYALLNLYTGNS